jgi:hypothetical protein
MGVGEAVRSLAALKVWSGGRLSAKDFLPPQRSPSADYDEEETKDTGR